MIRDDLLSYLTMNSTGSFALSVELPFSNSGVTLYQKNPKKIYADNDQVSVTPTLETMAKTYYTTTTTVNVYFSNDAKTLPADYNQAVELVTDFIREPMFNSYTSTSVETSTEFVNDLLITTITLTFEKFNT